MPESSGTLRIRAYTAGGALPVPGATVRITGGDDNNRTLAYSLTTDRDGLTDAVILPAPNVNYSLSPGAAEQPYAVYDVEISAPGYQNKRISGLTVFSGVESVQLVNMIPGNSNNLASLPLNNAYTVIPKTNLE